MKPTRLCGIGLEIVKQTMDKPLRVVHLPAWRDPYQQELFKSLRLIGVELLEGTRIIRFGIDLTLVGQLIKYPGLTAIHLHWQHPYFVGKSSVGSIVKGTFFLVQVLLLRVLRKRVVWTAHNITNHEQEFSAEEQWLTRLLIRFSSAVIVHCSAAKEILIGLANPRNREKIRVVPHGSFVARFAGQLMETGAARRKLRIPAEEVVFLYLGLIRPYKGVRELVTTFDSMDLPNTRLIVAGSIRSEQISTFISEYKKSSKQRITFYDRWIEDDEIPLFYGAANFAIAPYTNILTSGSVITAMSLSKAVIAPAIGCIPELLNEAGGYLYDPVIGQGLANAIAKATKEVAHADEFGRHNLEHIRSFRWDDIAVQTKRLYEY